MTLIAPANGSVHLLPETIRLGRKIWLIVTDIKSPDAHEAPGLFQVKEKTLAHQEPAS